MPHNEAQITDTLFRLLRARAETASICPSDVARALTSDEARWRALMPQIRAVAADLQRAGQLRITRGGADLSPDELEGGPIRLRRPFSHT